MDERELVLKVFNGLIEQGGCSINEKGCAYRGDNGRKCAAGQLIPDNKYKYEFEGIACWTSTIGQDEYTLNLTYNKERIKLSNEITQILIEEGYNPVVISRFQNFHDNLNGHTSETQVKRFTEERDRLIAGLNEGKTLSQLV